MVLTLAIAYGTGCGENASQDKALRERHAKFINALFTEDFDACVTITDPTVVQAKGADTVKGVYQVLGGTIKAANPEAKDVRIDNTLFNNEFTAVQVRTSYRSQGQWQQQAPSQWIRRKGQWFLVPAI